MRSNESTAVSTSSIQSRGLVLDRGELLVEGVVLLAALGARRLGDARVDLVEQRHRGLDDLRSRRAVQHLGERGARLLEIAGGIQLARRLDARQSDRLL